MEQPCNSANAPVRVPGFAPSHRACVMTQSLSEKGPAGPRHSPHRVELGAVVNSYSQTHSPPLVRSALLSARFLLPPARAGSSKDLDSPSRTFLLCILSLTMIGTSLVQARCAPCAPRRAARSARLVARAAAPEAPEAPSADKCAKCGVMRSDVPFGCDMDGHKVGGLGIFEWWPIKAWGPCPKAAEAGIPYTRKGQGLDEVLFGNSQNSEKK